MGHRWAPAFTWSIPRWFSLYLGCRSLNVAPVSRKRPSVFGGVLMRCTSRQVNYVQRVFLYIHSWSSVKKSNADVLESVYFSYILLYVYCKKVFPVLLRQLISRNKERSCHLQGKVQMSSSWNSPMKIKITRVEGQGPPARLLPNGEPLSMEHSFAVIL
jgi:hypothetical protein